jgi:hypothetical protein
MRAKGFDHVTQGAYAVAAILAQISIFGPIWQASNTTSITIEVKFCCSLRVLRQLYTFSAV